MFCNVIIPSLTANVPPPYQKKNLSSLIFFPSVLPHLGISVSLALLMSLVMMLTGSNAFRGLEGARQSDFGEWLMSAGKSGQENVLHLSSVFISTCNTDGST